MNATALKHAIASNKVLNKLTTNFQVKLINHSNNFKKNRDCNGVLLWKCLIKYIYPTIKVLALNHKDLLYNMVLKDFQYNVKRFNN